MYKPLVEWARERLEQSESLDLPELTEEAVDHFINDSAFLKQELYPIVYQQLIGILALTRRGGVSERPAETAQEKAARHARMESWREHAEGRYYRLIDMTRPLLRAAIRERKVAVEGAWRRILFLESVAKGLPDDKTKVGARFELAQLESMRRRYEEGTGNVDERVVAKGLRRAG